MIPASKLYKDCANSDSREIKFKISINGIEYEDEVISCNIQGGLSSSNDIVIGATPSMRINFVLRGTIKVTTKAVIKPYVAFKYSEELDTEWEQLGQYFAEQPTYESNETNVIGYDNWLWLDDIYECMLTFPIDVSDLLDDILDKKGLTTTFVPSPLTITQVPMDYTYREMLGFIASLYGGNAIFDNRGRFAVTFFRVVDTIDLKNCFEQVIDKETFEIEKVACVRETYDPLTYGKGDEYHTLAFINPFITYDSIKKVANELIGLTCNKMTITKQGTGLYFLGERLQTIDNTDRDKVINLLVSTIELNFSKGGFTETIGSCIRTSTDSKYNKESTLQESINDNTKKLNDVMYSYTNDAVINVSAVIDLINIRLTSDYNSTPIFLAYINMNVTTGGTFNFTYHLDNVVHEVKPIATLGVGYQILNLFLPMEFGKNSAHTFVVTCQSSDGGVAIIQRHQIQACIKGQGLTAQGSKWDGTINLDAELPIITIDLGDSFEVDMPQLSNSHDVSTHTPTGQGLSANASPIVVMLGDGISIPTNVECVLTTSTKEETNE